MPRVCSACGSDLPRSAFSKSQWSRGVGSSRCAECVQESHWEGAQKATARLNNSLAHDWNNWEEPDAEGTFRYVGFGRYTRGSRTGQRCVVKVRQGAAKEGAALCQSRASLRTPATATAAVPPQTG